MDFEPQYADEPIIYSANLATKCPLDNGRFHEPPVHDLGELDALPLEIVHDVLAALDLRTLTDLRRVNRRAMQVVDWLLPYQTIVKHAPNVLRAILSVESAPYVTCAKLYETLCASICACCDNFGGYLYLITCKRVCWPCFGAPAFIPVLRKQVLYDCNINSGAYLSLPRMWSLPGTYSGPVFSERHLLLDRESIPIASTELRRSPSQPRLLEIDYSAKSEGQPLTAEESMLLRHQRYDRLGLAIMHAPTIDRATRRVDWGTYCPGCQYEESGPFIFGTRAFRRKFTRASFPAHLEDFGPIQGRKHLE